MTHAIQTAFQDRLAALRGADFSVELDASGAINAPLFCDLDPESGRSTVRAVGQPGTVVSLETTIEGAPRWVVLRLELGEGAFAPGDVLVLVAQGAADHRREIGVYLRMVREGRLSDTRFDDTLKLSHSASVQTVMHTLSAMDPACEGTGQCALILGLPSDNCRVSLQDLALFVVPAAEGLRSTPLDFASFAA